MSTDGNFKLNLFFKRDNGTDITFTDGNMYFPRQIEFDRLVKQFVVSEEDKVNLSLTLYVSSLMRNQRKCRAKRI
jgi:hypothetical protein